MSPTGIKLHFHFMNMNMWHVFYQGINSNSVEVSQLEKQKTATMAASVWSIGMHCVEGIEDVQDTH